MKKIKNTKVLLAYGALILVVLIWSFSPIIANLNLVKDNYSPGMIIAMRGLFATIALAIISGKKLKKIDKNYLKVAVPSGFALGAASLVQMVGYRYGVNPGESAVLENLALLVIPVLLFFCAQQKPTWTKIVAAVLCFIGSAVIALSGSNGDLFAVSLGTWLACIAGILYGVNFVITGVYAKKLDPSVFVFIQISIQTLQAFLYSFIGEKLLLANENIFAFTWDIGPLMIVAMFGVVATGICWILRTYCFKTIPVMVVSIIMPFATVLTGVWSIIGGMEPFTWALLIGGVIVMAAILLAEVGDSIGREKKQDDCIEHEIKKQEE